MKANHEKAWVPIKTGKGETEILVNPGQFIFGRKTAAKELKMKESSVRNRIKKLENMQNLAMQPNTHCSVISIVNWGDYQSQEKKEDRQKDRQRTGKGQPKDTNKNDKNDKKKEKKSIKRKMPPDFSISERVLNWAEKNGHRNLDGHLESFKLKCEAKGYQYIDWDAAFMNAIRDDWAKLNGNGDGEDAIDRAIRRAEQAERAQTSGGMVP
jgi:hypothetical protein